MTLHHEPTRRWWALGLAAWSLAACQGPAGPPSHADLVRGHLTQIIGVQSPPCGAVLEYSRRGRLDYRVECASGQVYRVRVSADGHVVVKPYEEPASAPR